MSPHNGRSPVAKTLRVSVIMLNLLLTGTRMWERVSVSHLRTLRAQYSFALLVVRHLEGLTSYACFHHLTANKRARIRIHSHRPLQERVDIAYLTLLASSS